MAAVEGNGSITFGDNTTKTSAYTPYPQVSGAPTYLSQFTNNLGNYGGFLTAANIYQAYVYGAVGYAYNELGYRWIVWDGTNLYINTYNCNCVCNC